MTERVTVTIDDGIAVVQLVDPATRNALDGDMQHRLADAIRATDGDPAVRVIVLTGGNSQFVSGANIAELRTLTPAAITDDTRRVMWDALGAARTPIIAGIAGHVLGGGCEVALACDLVVAGDRAVLGLPEIRLGIMPGAGGVQRWARLAGRLRAAEAALTGRTVDAWTALDLGLVNRVVPQERTVEGAVALARQIVVHGPLATRAVTDAVDRVEELPLSDALERDRAGMADLLDTHDAREGLTAFLEKRSPRFEGR